MGVDGGNDGEVVLEFVNGLRGHVYGAIKGVDQGGVEGAIGEFRDDV